MAYSEPYTIYKRGRRAVILAFFLFMFVAASLPLTEASAYVSVRTDRPRLLLDSSDVTRIRETITTYNKTDFDAMVKYVNRQVVLSPDAVAKSVQIVRITRSTAFVGLITEDQQYIQPGIAFALAIAAIPAETGNDTQQGYRLKSMAYVYDWLYKYMTPDQKTAIMQGIVNHINYLEPWLDPNKLLLYTGGHSHHRNMEMLGALIALDDNTPGLDRQLLLTREKDAWENGYNPYQEYVCGDGGHYMGWKYGFGYMTQFTNLIWAKAVGEEWNTKWRHNLVYFFLYGLRGDKTFPRFGDYRDAGCAQDCVETIAVSAGRYKKPLAEWFYQTYLPSAWEPYRLFRILYRIPDYRPRSPEVSWGPQPFSKLFRHSGIVVARDSWGEDTTLLAFKSSSFNTYNHHHRDQNHFTLSYKGSLLIDSGYYDDFGTVHYKNYFIRSIAHNTMVAYDPAEEFKLWGKLLSNDGGQLVLGTEPKDLQEILESSKYQIKGITGYGLEGAVSWMKGDATAAYNPDKVETFTRDLLYVDRPSGRKRPLVLVLDQVDLKKDLKPTILFHSLGQPAVSGNFFAMNNANGGILYGMVLKPMLPAITAVGGSGKEFWVNGKNYPPRTAPTSGDVDAGTYRVEVTTKNPTQTATFLTLLAIDDAGDSDGMVSGALIEVSGYTGVRVGNDIYLIAQPVDGQIASQIALTSEQGKGVERIIVAGIGSTDLVQVNIGDQPFENVVVVKNTVE